MKDLIWIEVSKKALQHNLKTLRRVIGKKIILAPTVKANAYGHGLAETARLILKYGADRLCVNSLEEAEILRQVGIRAPLLIIGYAQTRDLGRVIKTGAALFVYKRETVSGLARLALKAKKKISVHIKVDTGMSRQGIKSAELLSFIRFIKKFVPWDCRTSASSF